MNSTIVRSLVRLRPAVAALLILTPSTTDAQVSVVSGFGDAMYASGIANGTAMEFAPDGRLFVCTQTGDLRVIKQGQLLATPFLSVAVDSSGERGLLGVAFDPNFAVNQFVYVYYTATTTPRVNRISRFTAAGDIAASGSEVVIMELDPLSSATNHNGGALHFGPDGKLYAGVGDNALGSNSQTLSNRLGKMLRINADGTMPTDNPFYTATTGANRSVWALGLRNPFTFAFDPTSPAMFINDVGQSTYEEIDVGAAGANYGWPATEGPTTTPGYTGPIYWYSHDPSATPNGCAITGGVFYRPTADAFPSVFDGDYFFSDLCSGFILRRDAASGAVLPFATGISMPVDLDIGPDGALYYLARGGGFVGRIQYVKPFVASVVPATAPPFLTGVSTTVIANLASSAGPVEYQFWLRAPNGSSWTSTAYATANSFTFTPSMVGTYFVQAWVRNVGSNNAWESFATGSVAVGPGPVVVTDLTGDQQVPPAAGAPLTWTAQSIGGEPPHTYEFWVYQASTQTWTLGRAYDSSPSWTWTPSSPGTYVVQVWVRSAGSLAAYDGWRGTGFFDVAPAVPATPRLVANPLSPVTSGTLVTWSASTSGGRQPTQYRFWIYNQSTGVWTIGQDWSAASTWAWRPSQAGAYVAQVWLRSAGSAAMFEAWAGSNVFVVSPAPVTALALTSSASQPFAPGSSVTWEVAASGGSVPLEYQFWGLTSGSGWTLVRDYAADPSASWTLTAGSHVLQAWVREQGSTAAFQSWVGTGSFGVASAPVTILSVDANQTFPIPANTPITWTVRATGGAAPLEYEWWRYSANTATWQIVQPWGSSNVLTWAPASSEAGTYNLQVWARSTGSTQLEAWVPFGPFAIVP